MFIVALGLRPTAGRERAAGVQDPGQVPEHGSGIVARGLVSVIARPGQWLQDELEVPALGCAIVGVAGERGRV
jgi:hypothetical protein